MLRTSMDPLLKVKRLKQIDYEDLKRQADGLRSAGAQSFSKYKKLAGVSKQSKDQEMLKQHRGVWHKELARINSLRKTLTRDLDELSLRALTQSDGRHAFLEFESLDNSLAKDRDAFKEAVVAPVFMLSEDLKFYAQRKLQNAAVPDPGPVRDLVAEMRGKLAQVEEALQHEELALSQDLDCDALREFSHQDLRMIHTGIPEEAWEAECPDDNLKAALVQEFLLLDQSFQERLDDLILRERPAPPPPRQGSDWSAEERQLLDTLSDEYEHNCQGGRHLLKMDMFVRACPHRSRQDLLTFEVWWSVQRAVTAQRRALLADWVRSRQELLARLKVEFQEAQEQWDLAVQRKELAQQQQQLCEALCLRVSQWRERRLEADRLAAELREEEARRRAKEEEEERAKELERREKEKEKIKEFRKGREEEAAIEAARQQQRLMELRAYLEQQAAHDRERVEYREQLLERRREEAADRAEQRREQVAEAEARLERLRLQVRPQDVAADPERMQQATAAWQHRVQPEDEDDAEAPLHQPLFATNTYSDRQLLADPRLKIEVALRNAGLAESAYARSVLSNLKPLHPPRKDAQSTLRFGDS